jgi:hypothetical protein
MPPIARYAPQENIPPSASQDTISRSLAEFTESSIDSRAAASRSSRNLGSGSGFLGMSQAMTGLRGGASGQSHSMIRSKNARTVRIRCRQVSAVMTRPPALGWMASHAL